MRGMRRRKFLQAMGLGAAAPFVPFLNREAEAQDKAPTGRPKKFSPP